MDGGVLVLIDQRQLPDALVEVENRSAGEVAYSIREMVVRGAPAIGQVAAIGLALSAERIRDAGRTPGGPRSGAGPTRCIQTRPTAVNLRWAVDRLMARYEAIGDLSEDGEAIADAIRAEADAIVFEATDDHGRLAEFGLDGPARAGRRPAADPDPLQHRAARLRPVRDRARGRPGRPPRRARRSTSGSTRPGRTCRAHG